MERIKKIFQSYEKHIKNLGKLSKSVTVSINAPENALYDRADRVEKQKSGDNLDVVSRAFFSSLTFIPYYKGFVNEKILKRDMLANIGSLLSYFCFATHDIETVAFISAFDQNRDPKTDANKLDSLFKNKFGFGLNIRSCDRIEFIDILMRRHEGAQEFFLSEQGGWIQEFLDSLQDKISVLSFLTFLKQRIFRRRLHKLYRVFIIGV